MSQHRDVPGWRDHLLTRPLMSFSLGRTDGGEPMPRDAEAHTRAAAKLIQSIACDLARDEGAEEPPDFMSIGPLNYDAPVPVVPLPAVLPEAGSTWVRENTRVEVEACGPIGVVCYRGAMSICEACAIWGNDWPRDARIVVYTTGDRSAWAYVQRFVANYTEVVT